MRRVVAFGSRATWTAKEYSDLDLAVLGDEPLPLDAAAALAEGFAESDLPFKVDVVVWADIDDHLRNIIRRDAVNVQTPEADPASTPGPPSSADRLHLSARHRRVLEALLREHLPDVEVWAYGSRVNGRSHTGSDLDLVLRGPGLEKTPTEQLADFADAVRESTIPFLVEARDWTRLPERLQREIGQNHEVFVDGSVDSSQQTVGDFFSLQRGTTYKSRLLGNDGPVLLGLASIQRNGGFRADNLRTYGGECPEKLLVHPGELYVSLKDVTQSADLLGAVAMVPRNHAPGRLTQDTVKLEPKRDDAPLHYIHWLLRTPQYRHYCRACATGTTNLGLPRGDFLAYPVPDLTPTRRRVVDMLNALDDKIELNRRMNETLEAMARALFKSWFVDFEPVRAKMEGRDTGLPRHIAELFPDRMIDSEHGEIPDGWHIRPLGDLIDVNPRRRLRKGQLAPYLDMANMPTKGHVPNSVVGRAFGSGMRFTNGDTLVARITPCLENGKAAFVDFLPNGETGWGSTEYIVMRPRNPLPHEFAYLLARSSTFREFAIQNMTGTSGRQRVQASAVKEYRLAQPAERVAVAFGDLVGPLTAKGSASARESRSLAGLRDTLLPKLVSGELRISDAESLVEPPNTLVS